MPSRMSARDEIAVVEGYRTILGDWLASMDPAAVLRLRGELQVLSRWLAVQKKSALQRTADEALDVVARFSLFGQDSDGLRAAARAAIDELFAKFDDPGVALATRLALLYQLYALLAIIRCAELLEDLRGLA